MMEHAGVSSSKGRDREMAPRNMSLCHEDYFELKTAENQQMQEEFSVLALIHLKVGHSFP